MKRPTRFTLPFTQLTALVLLALQLCRASLGWDENRDNAGPPGSVRNAENPALHFQSQHSLIYCFEWRLSSIRLMTNYGRKYG